MRRYELLGERFFCTDSGTEVGLAYALVWEEGKAPLRYGLCVTKDFGKERTEVLSLSESREKMENLGRKLLASAVTPVVLAETLEDILKEYRRPD